MKKNPYYWNKEEISLDYVEIFVEINRADRLYLFEQGKTDFVDVPSLMVDSYINEVDFYYSGGCDFLLFNQKNSLLSHLAFRKALIYAVDRNEFVDITTKGIFEASTRFVLPVVDGVQKSYGEEYPLSFYPKRSDLQKAREFLEKGMKEVGIENPKEISFTILTSEGEKQGAAVLANMIEDALGINIEVESVIYRDRLVRESENQYDIVYTGWTPDYNDPMSYLEIFVSNSTYNHGAYNSEAYDALVKRARLEIDEKARLDLLFEAEKVLLEDGAIIPLQFRKMAWMKNPKLVGVYKTFYGTRENFIYADFVE